MTPSLHLNKPEIFPTEMLMNGDLVTQALAYIER